MNIQELSDSLINVLSKDEMKLIIAVKIMYKEGALYVHTGVGEKIIDGQTYLGVGALGDISALTQTSETSPNTITLTLNGMDPSYTEQVLNQRSRGTEVTMMLCSLDDYNRVDNAVIIYVGNISTQRYQLGQTLAIEVDVTDKFADWERVRNWSFDNEGQQRRHDGDKFFQALAQMSDATLYWGSKKDAPPVVYS